MVPYLVVLFQLSDTIFSFLDGIQRTDYKAHVTLFDYRLQAINGLWKARKTAQIMMDEVISERTKRSQMRLLEILWNPLKDLSNTLQAHRS